MQTDTGTNIAVNHPEWEGRLPRFLKQYTQADFITQLKARFILTLILLVISGVLFTIGYTLYIDMVESPGQINLFVFVPQVLLLAVYFAFLIVLKKGHYRLTANGLMMATFAAIWSIIYFDSHAGVRRMDTVIIVVAALSMLPLVVSKNRWGYLFYVLANLAALIVFVVLKGDEAELDQTTRFEFLSDSIIALVYSSIIGFNVLKIYNRSLEKVESDMHSRRLAEEALMRSEKRYREMTELLPQAIYEANAEWKITYVNQRGLHMFGYSEADIANGMGVFSLLDPDEHTLLKENLQSLIQGKHSQGNQYMLIRKDGTRVPVQAFSSLIEEGGKISGIRGIIIDISERVKAEQELIESEKKYRTLLENMNEVVMMVDHDDRIRFVNSKFTEKLGYAADEVLGKIGYELLLSPSDYEVIRQANQLRLQNRSSQYELTFESKSGEKIDFLVSGSPLFDSLGNPVGSIGTMTDITERKKAEKALRESEDRFRSVIEMAPFEIILTDMKGRMLLVNKAFCQVYNISAEEVVGRMADDFQVTIEPEHIEVIREMLKKQGFIENMEIPVRIAGKETKYFYYAARIIHMHGEPVILNTTLNITDKKKNEQELERYRYNLEQLVRERTEELSKANEELKSANELLTSQQEELQATLTELHQAQDQLIESEKMASLGILAAGVAHEINNPLNFIQGGAMGLESYLHENLKDHVQAVETLLQGIHVGVDRAARIVTSLNHFSRMNEACDEIFDVNQVVENCLTMIHNKIRYRIEVTKEFAPESLTIMGNEGKLHQVFLNILSNAYQAIENTGTISIRTCLKNGQVILKISDSGLGIAPENLNRIFNPFFTTKDPGKGTGLGLSISYKIIQEHNGTIQYESAPEQGTTVTIIFPYYPQAGS